MLREIEVKYGTLSRLAVEGNSAVVVVHNSMHHRQTQTGAFSRRFCREKWLEDPLHRRLPHAVSRITDGYARVDTRLQPRLRCCVCRRVVTARLSSFT